MPVHSIWPLSSAGNMMCTAGIAINISRWHFSSRFLFSAYLIFFFSFTLRYSCSRSFDETFSIDLYRVCRWQEMRIDIEHLINWMRLRMCRNVRVRVLRMKAEEKRRIWMDVIDIFITIRSVRISLELVQSVVTGLLPSFFLDSDLWSTLEDRWHRSFQMEILRNSSRDSSDSDQSWTRSDPMSEPISASLHVDRSIAEYFLF